MRKLLYFIMGCVIVGVIISTIFTVVPKFPSAGRAFLYAAKQGQYGQAYNMFSDDFQKLNSLEALIKALHDNQLDKYKEVSWLMEKAPDRKSADQTHAHVMGIMITTDNQRIPVAVYFIKTNNKDILAEKWRIEGFETGDAVMKKIANRVK